MMVPILATDEEAKAKQQKMGLARRTAVQVRQRLFDCLAPTCPRRVRICMSLLFCMALLAMALYVDIVAVLFLDSLRRHQPALPMPPSALIKLTKSGAGSGGKWAPAVLDARNERRRKMLNATMTKLLRGLPAKDDQWCQRMASGQLDAVEAKLLADWKFDQSLVRVLPDPNTVAPAELPEAGCSALHQLFPFADEPGSEEEQQYPLAYGMLVYKNAFQVYALLSTIYQPQNTFCLAVDERASDQFKQEMNLLADCFPNIFVMEVVGKVEWCQFGVVRGVFSCLRYLAGLDHNWRYYQYLSGVDLPLKTNLEMVRIFKQLNSTVNVEILPFETGRIAGKQALMKNPLTLWKSSLSALLSREAVKVMVESEKIAKLLRYLQHGYCSDEAIWGTMTGNPKELYIPGGFDAEYLYGRLFKEIYVSKIWSKQQQQMAQMDTLTTTTSSNSENDNNSSLEQSVDLAEPFRLSTYYISRIQVWQHTNLLSGSNERRCNGTFVKSSCVFGIGDVPRLVKKPELVVHKLYLDYQPAAYFCLLKNILERTLDWRSQQQFQGKVYAQLPTVKMARGEPEDQLRFFFE